MNYTQLYKRANMRKVATAALIYKVASLLKRAELKEAVDPYKQSAGLGTWGENMHIYPRDMFKERLYYYPGKRSYFSLLKKMAPITLDLPTRPLTSSYLDDISRGDVDSTRKFNARGAALKAFDLPSSSIDDFLLNLAEKTGFKLPSSFNKNYDLYELAKKIGKWKEQQWKETGIIPTKMSPELLSEYNNTVKGITLPEGRTLQLAKDIFYKSISDANKRRRHSNVG